ncbi:PREDICTED: hepatocyte growth factor activator [Chrysochloris asiatica]|uniref:Serine protease HGFAC n=1 Tax=Chrysochloris asiatica TaxID=185453 RepID=A0A9B0UAK3_CHRAS|nr:PREDICTED: hepatocyte growth factor activator [Chrysochloris asiatica]
MAISSGTRYSVCLKGAVLSPGVGPLGSERPADSIRLQTAEGVYIPEASAQLGKLRSKSRTRGPGGGIQRSRGLPVRRIIEVDCVTRPVPTLGDQTGPRQSWASGPPASEPSGLAPTSGEPAKAAAAQHHATSGGAMGFWVWVPGHCPLPGPFLLPPLLLLLLASGGAQLPASRVSADPSPEDIGLPPHAHSVKVPNWTESPQRNTTVTPGAPTVPSPSGAPWTSVTPSTPAASTSEAPVDGHRGEGPIPTPRGDLSSTEDRVLTEDGQTCRFPFRYGGRMHQACTSEGSARRKWCATTHNYDRDRSWGYCAPTTTRPLGDPGTLDPCASSPCLNGASCSSTQDSSSYLCSCPMAFTGKDCSQKKCFDRTRYEYLETGDHWARVHQGHVEQCSCAGGEAQCQDTRHTACLSNPCLNGGTCHLIVATGTTICACLPGYAGRLCNIVPAESCFLGNGTQYRGVASTAASGLSCLAWNSDLLYQELHVDSVSAAALLGLGPHAYCRNPDRDERPWCYVLKDNMLSWEYCRLVACESLTRRQPPSTPEVLLTMLEPAAPGGRRTCGKRHKKRNFLRPRIIGGSAALPGSHPWLAAVYIGDNFCAGSLIHTCWVVSAAHCFSNSPRKESVSVVLGQHFFNLTTDVTQTFGIEKYIPYPRYSVFNPSDHDLVLIRLKRKGDRCAVRSQFVQPICLPEPSSSFPTGHKCQIAGWGHMGENMSSYSSSLREALVPLVADHKCSSPEVYGADISPNMLCAGYFDCKADACQGDSGGPLACEKNGVAYLYGIISWGDGCGRVNKPGVYTRVTNYVDWINDRLRPPKRPADSS